MLAIATAFKTLNKRTHHEESSGIDTCRQRRVGRSARPRQGTRSGRQAHRTARPVSVTLSAWSVTLDKAGKETFKRAESAKPGDVIEYRAELRNVSRATLKDQALTLPVPPGTAYVPSSARPASAGSRGRWQVRGHAADARRAQCAGPGRKTAVPPEAYRALRWPVADLPAGKSFKATARVRVTDTPAEATKDRPPATAARPRRAVRTSHRVFHRGAISVRPGTLASRTRRRAAFDGSTLRKFMRALPKKSATLARRCRAGAGGMVMTSGIAQAAPGRRHDHQQPGSRVYTDGQGIDRVSQSNAVETLVLPKAAFSLASDNTKQAAPGSTVYFSHALTNTGNAADQFKITVDKPANTVGSPASTCDIYIDEDGNGLPDSNTSIGTCGKPFNGLGAGWRRLPFRHRRHGQRPRPPRATKPRSPSTPRASMIRTGAAEKNTDTLQVTNGAAFNVNKSANLSSGPTGTVITYTFTIANTGNAAGDLTLTDALGSAPPACSRVRLGRLVQWTGRADGCVGRR